MEPNERGHYPLEPLGVELGLWQGNYHGGNQLWLRWWDKDGNLLLTGWEQTELERLHVEQERQRAEQAEEALMAKTQAQQEAIPRFLAMGLTVEQIAEALGLSVEQVRQQLPE